MVRRHTSPIPLNVADQWKKRLSLVYAIFAWNAFGLVVYQLYKGKSNWASEFLFDGILYNVQILYHISWIKFNYILF
jgi:hypothetical protein